MDTEERLELVSQSLRLLLKDVTGTGKTKLLEKVERLQHLSTRITPIKSDSQRQILTKIVNIVTHTESAPDDEGGDTDAGTGTVVVADADGDVGTGTGAEANASISTVPSTSAGVGASISTSAGETEGDAVVLTTWLAQLIAKDKLAHLDESQFESLIIWLQSCLASNIKSDICPILRCLSGLLRTQTQFAAKYCDLLFHPDSTDLLQRLRPTVENDETVIVLINCLDTMLNGVVDSQLSSRQIEVWQRVASTLIEEHYTGSWSNKSGVDPMRAAIFVLNSLTLLQKVVALCPAYAQVHASDLFGLSKAYIKYGIHSHKSKSSGAHLPQKVPISQQSLYDSSEETNVNSTQQRNTGGKISKTRKPRAVVKGMRQQFEITQHQCSNALLMSTELGLKTSDSDLSESEAMTANRAVFERRRNAKIRLAAINLLGVVARVIDRRYLYGYWHALFPSATCDDHHNTDLLHVGRNDPNVRCRSTALQIAAQLLFGSKRFLSQAESDTRRSATAFMPFAMNLGLTVLNMYKLLTSILATESSLPVLTQALKCLAVLIQATPLDKLDQGFVTKFMQHIKTLVVHRDCTIQVSTLMVLEFLVATPILTSEIASVIGLPMSSSETSMDFKSNQFENSMEPTNSGIGGADNDDSAQGPWLLQRILDNLDYDEQRMRAQTAVRVESLQVLVAISTHFSLLTDHLGKVVDVLHKSLEDTQADVRLYAGRCLDSIAYQMNQYLQERNTIDKYAPELKECVEFWTRLLPIVYGVHSHSRQEQLPALKVCLCDALSNIGPIIFERLPHTYQRTILVFLSGNSSEESEDIYVRAAAVRALAVYVLFASLRDDLVFVENTAELTLRLCGDTNIYVRIKALWSLGNISDALINKVTADSMESSSEESEMQQPQSTRQHGERISNDLLHRLIVAATEACSDNDKVRSNAVRSLGNLLRLITTDHLDDNEYRCIFQRAIGKLIDCIRATGNAKVKWNACYAISNLMKNREIFTAANEHADLQWQTALYPALCHVIVHHPNFKVRINASAAILNIEERAFFGTYFEQFWTALIGSIEQSYNLDNYFEYNHRDGLQEQLCLAISHIINCATLEDFPMLRKQLAEHHDVVCNTWTRVTNRMVPERVAPLLGCSQRLQELLLLQESLTPELQATITYIANVFRAQ